jgi:two-component system sensor histidine kinase YesM
MTKKTLFSKIAIPFTLLFSISGLLLYMIISTLATRYLENMIVDDMLAKQSDVSTGLSLIFDDMNLTYSRMVLDPELKKILEDDSRSEEEKDFEYQTLISSVGYNNDLFLDIIVYYDGFSLSNNAQSNVVSSDFIESVSDSNNLLLIGSPQFFEDRYIIPVGKKMRNFPLQNGDGVVVFLINELALREIYSSVNADYGVTFIFGEEIITHSEGEGIGDSGYLFDIDGISTTRQVFLQDKNYIVVNSELEEFNMQYNIDWSIVSLLEERTIFYDIYGLNRLNILITVLVTIISLILAYVLSKRISTPFEKMVYSIKQFADNLTKNLSKEHPFEEIRTLDKAYDEMMQQILDLLDSKEKEAEAKRALELYSLQVQINPHFLYNTLDAIAWMAKMKDQSEIEQLSLSLAEFFRLSLHKGEKFITIAEEFDIIRRYMEIESIRFPGKINVEYNIEEGIEDLKTLKLILQPLVENAIKHGLSQKSGVGTLLISASKSEDDILLSVADNGAGFDIPNNLFSIENQDIKQGYGLRNVNDRLLLEYGESYGLTVTSEKGVGSTVVAKIKIKSTL